MSQLSLHASDIAAILQRATHCDEATCKITDAVEITIKSARLHAKGPSVNLAARIRLRLLSPSTIEIQHRLGTHDGWVRELLLSLFCLGMRKTLLKVAAGAVEFPKSGHALLTISKWQFIDIDMSERDQAVVVSFNRD